MYFADKTSIQEAVNTGELGHEENVQLDYTLDEGKEPAEGESVIQDKEALLESFIVDALSRMDDASREEFMKSDAFNALYEASTIKHRSVVRLSKNADFERRVHLAALQRAREKGDADWEALRKNRINERRLLDKIYNKYSMQVKRDAIQAQKRLININPQVFNTMRAIR